MRTPIPLAGIGARLAVWGAAGICLVASHDLVFLIQVGPGDELTRLLRQAGHGYWAAGSLALGALGVAAAVVVALRLHSLRRSVARLGGPPTAASPAPIRRWAAAWALLLGIVLVGFAVQENVEHWIAHNHLLGLGALIGPEYPLAVPVIAAITALAAVAVASVRRTEGDLIIRLAAAVTRRLRPDRRPLRPIRAARLRRLTPMARSAAGRAPPSLQLPAT